MIFTEIYIYKLLMKLYIDEYVIVPDQVFQTLLKYVKEMKCDLIYVK